MIDKYQDDRIAENQKAVEANQQAIKNLKGKK